MNMPLVTIAIPAYNAEKTIKQTLQSLLAQTYPNIEIIVVDNASTDNSVQIVKSFNNHRIQLVEREVNYGAEDNFDKCMNIGNGEYTALFHADDVYHASIVEKQVALLENNPDLGCVTTSAILIDDQNRKIGATKSSLQLGFKRREFVAFDLLAMIKKILRYYNFIVTPSGLVRSHIYKNEIKKMMAEEFSSSADLAAWLRIAQNHKVGLLFEPLMSYRISKQQYTYRYNHLRVEQADFFKVMDYFMKLPEVESHLTDEDYDYYKEQKRRDYIRCALNAILLGDVGKSRDLLRLSKKQKTQVARLNSLTACKIFVYNFFARLLSLPIMASFVSCFVRERL